MAKEVKLGQKVKDRITGFEGMVTVRAEHIYGCVRLGIQGGLDKDGKPMETQFFDEAQVDVIETTDEKKKGSKKAPAGPRVDPPSRSMRDRRTL